MASKLNFSNNYALVVEGQKCIEAAQTVFNLITTQKEADVAVNRLSMLKETGRSLQDFAEDNKRELLSKEKQLNNELATLESQKYSYESAVSRLTDEKRRAEGRLYSQRRLLADAEAELRRAEESLDHAKRELRRAKEKEKAAMTTSVVTGVVVGLFTFGVGGAAVGGALGAGVAALINELEGKVKRAQSNIQCKRADIDRANGEIRSTSSTLSNIEREITNNRSLIASNKKRISNIHDKITSVVNSIAFQKEAADFWKMFTEATERATERTERLRRIVDKAAKKKNFKILRSDGTITIAKTFVEAWEEVTIKEGQIMFIEN